jgi:PAS domain S-box-containing protein
VGVSFADLFSRSDDRVIDELRAFVRSGYSGATVQTALVDAQGKRVYRTRTQFGIVENDELVRIWGTTRDVTDLKRAQLAAEASERRFRQVLEKIHVPAVMLDHSGEITFCNDVLVRLAGSSRRELIGRNWLDVIGSARVRDAWSALLSADADPDGQNVASLIKSRDGVAHLIVWDAVLLRDEDGNRVGVAAIGTDKGPTELD